MKAVNAAGESGASTASGSVTPYTNPASPTIISIIGNNVTFISGNTNGSNITGYQYSTNGGSYWSSLGFSITSVTLIGLTLGSSYTLLLQTQNAAGWSVSASQMFIACLTPPTPTLSASGIVITVTAGTNTNGAIITNYQWSKNNVVWVSIASVQSSFTLIPSGLTAGSSYTIYVRAINAGIINGSGASISISVPSPTYVASVVTIPAVSITAGSIGSAVTTVTASLGTTLTAGALANSNVLTVDLSAATNITSIPEGTFSGSTLTSIILPDTITSIGTGAFTDCAGLTTINITHVNSIGEAALQGTAISTITITGTTAIAAWALSNCTSMVTASF